MIRILWCIDLVGSIAVMAEAAAFNDKTFCAFGLILILTCFWVSDKLRNE
jgi:hypothetical protein